MATSEPLVIDPRRHDAVLFDAAVGDAPPLPGLATAVVPAGQAPRAAAERLGVRPGRAVVLAADPATVAAARADGFAWVIGVDRGGRGDALRDAGADAVVTGPGDVTVRTGDRRMSELPDALDALDGLATRRPAVFFDFDGTLSDIVDDPDAAVPVPGATRALARLAARCPVAVLSGRDLADVTKRVGVPGIWYAGSHGFELTAPDGSHHQNEAAAAAIDVLAQAAAALRDRLAEIPGIAVEHKRFGVAVHYRNAARDRVGEVAAAVRAAGRRDELRVTTGREVIELRPDLDWDKGKTLRWVIEHLRTAGSAGIASAAERTEAGRAHRHSGALTPVYLGDDITDEDAFDAVRADGVPIVVRHNDDGDRPTAARYALDSPARAAEFTDRLAAELEARDG